MKAWASGQGGCPGTDSQHLREKLVSSEIAQPFTFLQSPKWPGLGWRKPEGVEGQRKQPPDRTPRCPQHPSPECLSSVLEVHQFAQEAVVADAWLTAQEPLLQSRELGSSVDEVEQLIRRHEAFRKAAAAWEERFSSLRRLTTVSTPFPAPDPTPHSPTSISLYETNTRANTRPPRCVE